jgi:hypothetical protein
MLCHLFSEEFSIAIPIPKVNHRKLCNAERYCDHKQRERDESCGNAHRRTYDSTWGDYF